MDYAYKYYYLNYFLIILKLNYFSNHNFAKETEKYYQI